MADWCKEAGLHGLNSHSVRKAAATRMAERGASVHALMATFAWLDIKQAELYTRQAQRRRLAGENAHLRGQTRMKPPAPCNPRGWVLAHKRNEIKPFEGMVPQEGLG